MPHKNIVRTERNRRQKITMAWAKATWGKEAATSPRMRAMRFIEEAMELVQAQGLSEADVNLVAKDIFSRPVGETAQEVGGVMTSLNCLVENCGLSTDECEIEELKRVLDLDPEILREKQEDKVRRGLV